MIDIFKTQGSISKYNDVKSALKYGDYEKCPNPKLSVIMPVYKRPEMLRIGLNSVLTQKTNFLFEVVIVDNYEGKDSPNYDIAKSSNDSRVFYYKNEKNLGMYGNFNRGISLARGEYVTFCHDDDTLPPDSIRQLYDMKQIIGKEIIIGEHNHIGPHGEMLNKVKHWDGMLGVLKLKKMRKLTSIDLMIENPGIGGGGDLFDKDVLIELGGFTEELYPGCDYALILRYFHKYGAYKLLKDTYNYRIADNASFEIASSYASINRDFHQMLSKFIILPDLLTEIIIRSLYYEDCINLNKRWKANISFNSRLGFFYFLIAKFMRLYNKIRNYKI